LRYVSTEGRSSAVSLETALFSGPAPDGGLYVPEKLPALDVDRLGEGLVERAATAAHALFAEDVPAGELDAIVAASLSFPIPLVEIEEGVYCLELFHGPTLAFKDVGARFMARLMLHFLERRGDEATVLVATSGDTGSAVAQAFYRLEGIRVVVLFPKDRVSPLQRRLFSTLGENVAALEVEGSFDDCQRLVKRAFADDDLGSRRTLVSANSINVGRLLPQSFYYFHAQRELARIHDGAPIFSTPSGNFGNLTAGLMAKRMGMPARRFVAATNANDVVPEYLDTARFRPRPSVRTISNAMDVGEPSNFARILWLYGGSHDAIGEDVVGSSHSDATTRAAMRDLYDRTGRVVDPHSAIGYRGGMDARNRLGDESSPLVFLATAHPAKFREVVEEVLGRSVPLPEALAAAAEGDEHVHRMRADYGELAEYLAQ
jgi:threonine synthase